MFNPSASSRLISETEIVNLTHIDKFSVHESGAFLENFSKKKFLLPYDVIIDDNWNESRGINRWRVGASRHDSKVNLVGYLF